MRRSWLYEIRATCVATHDPDLIRMGLEFAFGDHGSEKGSLGGSDRGEAVFAEPREAKGAKRSGSPLSAAGLSPQEHPVRDKKGLRLYFGE